jgi:hypothetical protein
MASCYPTRKFMLPIVLSLISNLNENVSLYHRGPMNYPAEWAAAQSALVPTAPMSHCWPGFSVR